jgi:hypothetical protein
MIGKAGAAMRQITVKNELTLSTERKIERVCSYLELSEILIFLLGFLEIKG